MGKGSKHQQKTASSGSSSRKKRKLSTSSSSSPRMEVAALYKEDITTTSTGIMPNHLRLHPTSNSTSTHRPASVGTVKVNREEKKRRKDRMARFNVEGSISGGNSKSSPATKKAPVPTAAESLGQALRSSRDGSGASKEDEDGDEYNRLMVPAAGDTPFVGENTSLEKPYLRLTTYPRKCDVRPEPVLHKALAHIKNRYLQTEDFEWSNEQLKSVRQDLTVQNIRNNFTLDVYETHARILLEHGDLPEFNQCQSNIQSLVAMDDDGADSASVSTATSSTIHQSEESVGEFRAYAVLYALVRNADMDLKVLLTKRYEDGAENTSSDAKHSSSNNPHPKKKRKRRRHSSTIGSSSPASSEAAAATTDSSVSRSSTCSAAEEHAWLVVRAVQDNAYRTFFRLYRSAPHMSAYLMDYLVQRVRMAAWASMAAAYRPHVSCEHVRDCLHLDDLEETRRFLGQQGAVYLQESNGNHEPPFWVDCKQSQLQQLQR